MPIQTTLPQLSPTLEIRFGAGEGFADIFRHFLYDDGLVVETALALDPLAELNVQLIAVSVGTPIPLAVQVLEAGDGRAVLGLNEILPQVVIDAVESAADLEPLGCCCETIADLVRGARTTSDEALGELIDGHWIFQSRDEVDRVLERARRGSAILVSGVAADGPANLSVRVGGVWLVHAVACALQAAPGATWVRVVEVSALERGIGLLPPPII